MPTVFEVKAEVFSLQQQLCFLVQAFCSDISDRFKKQKKSSLESHLSKHIMVDGFMLNQVLKRQKSNSSPFNFTLEITSFLLSDNFQEAEAEEVRVKAEFENKTEVARSQRDYQLNKSSYDIEVNTKVSTKCFT